jgi:hypothetical protein
MNKSYKKSALISLGLTATLFGGNALADVQTLVGTNVTFQYDDDLLGLYGTPTVAGNSLIFTPTTFNVQSTNGQGIVQTSSTVNVQIFANAGFNFPAVMLEESGDYALIGSDAQVAVGGQIRAYDLLNPLPNSLHLTDNIVASAPLTTTTSLAPYSTTNWNASASLVLPTAWSAGGVNLTIENILLASTSFAGSSAFLEKKFLGTAVVITAVPEAQTYGMMLAGLGLVGWMAGRRRRNLVA